jgi:hypothetical protein
MARKSKGKFNMKGHSIPGIKGFKGTTLEDGRAASSAFQMQSPFLDHETDMDEESDTYGQVIVHDDTDGTTTDNTTTDYGTTTDDNTDVVPNPYEHGMDWSDIEKAEYNANRATPLAPGQDQKSWALSEIAKAIKRKKANKSKENDITDTTNDDTTNDDTTSEIVDINNDNIPDSEQPELFNEDGTLKGDDLEEKIEYSEPSTLDILGDPFPSGMSEEQKDAHNEEIRTRKTEIPDDFQ